MHVDLMKPITNNFRFFYFFLPSLRGEFNVPTIELQSEKVGCRIGS